VTAYVGVCPAGCGWESNVCVTEDDAAASVAYHLDEVPHAKPGEEPDDV
jgi:hypothetical protein